MMDDLTRQEILAATTRFYTALAQADLVAMSNLWCHSPLTECIHPGWDRLRGWPAIRESWSRIFQHQGPMPVQFSEPVINWRGEMAWVICYENVSQTAEGMVQISQMIATNVFERVEGHWRMVIHHASPAPPGTIQPRTWRTSLN